MYKLYCDKSELSVGQLYLLDICVKRKLTEFWNEKLEKKFSVAYLYRVATGKHKTPSLNLIYSMLNYVDPTDWFIRKPEGEKSEPFPKDGYVTDITQSINFKKLVELHDKKLINKFCIDSFGEKSKHYLIKFQHLFSGRNSVSTALIEELKDVLPVSDWFIAKK